jgi:hypothetical protein
LKSRMVIRAAAFSRIVLACPSRFYAVLAWAALVQLEKTRPEENLRPIG